MDITTVWTVMDRMRETQHRHGAILDAIQKQLDQLTKRQDEFSVMMQAGDKSKDASPLPKWLSFSRPIVQSAAQWATGLLTMAYILRGGDLMTGLKILVGLSG